METQLGNCPLCGRLYLKNNIGLCPACYQLEESQANVVADYIRENPNSTIAQIHKDTGVKESVILRMIKSGRLVGISYPCEHCGTPILSGTLCEKCAVVLAKELQQAKQPHAKPAPKNKGIGMYTKHYKNK